MPTARRLLPAACARRGVGGGRSASQAPSALKRERGSQVPGLGPNGWCAHVCVCAHAYAHTGGGCFSSFEQLKACHEEKLQIPEAEGLGVGPSARTTHDLASSLAPLRPAPLPVGRAPGLAHGAWLASDTGGDAGHAPPCHSPPGGEGGCAQCGWAPGPPGDRVPAARCARPRAAPAHPELCPPVSEPLPTPRRAAQGPGSPSARRGHRTAAGPEQAHASRGPLARAAAAAAVPARHSANIS